MDICAEFPTAQDVLDYVKLNNHSICDELLKGNDWALRLINMSRLLPVLGVGVKVMDESNRSMEFAVMLASEIIRDYEISIGIR